MSLRVFVQQILSKLLGAGLLCVALSYGAQAQEQVSTYAETGPSVTTVQVRRGTVVYVSGNDVVIKGEDGQIRDYPNVPEDARVTVDGNQLSVHEVRPGMTIERTTITTETPRVITTIKSVKGTIWQISPPTSVILTLENGKNQQFKIPPETKFFVDGQQTDVFSLRPGMKVSATAVTEVPETVVTKQVERTGTMPPPPPETIDATIALLVVMVPILPPDNTQSADTQSADASTAAAEVPPTQLPKTGTWLPLFGLLGSIIFSLGLALGLKRALNS